MKRLMAWRKHAVLLGVVAYILTTACATILTSNSVPFTIVAQDKFSVAGNSVTPITIAIRGDDPNRTVPDGLPEQAKEALRNILSKPDPALYVVVYAGRHGSTGWRVRINSITRQRDTAPERLVVNYSVDQPPGGGTVVTYPFIIARVETQIPASQVVFEGPPYPTPAVVPLSYEIIAMGAPIVGGGQAPITFAIRGNDPQHTLPSDLPSEAQAVLQSIYAKAAPDLYLVLYGGVAPGTDYTVGIDFIEMRREAGTERLTVRYRVDHPQSTTFRPSYPFLIVRVKNTNARPADVVFEH
ncbi:MAG: protease complex subunit PrcB family protein [Chloroflexi bacterium]|nr:protease complex subunit PrcB family protein [Chloroflexota bacterium]